MNDKSDSIIFTVSEEGRLDKFLLEKLRESPESGLTRSQIKNLIEAGKIEVSGKKVTKAGTIVKHSARVIIDLEKPAKEAVAPWEQDIAIVYEDKFLIAVNKPPFISMHPGAGRKDRTLVNALSAHFSKELLGRDARAGVVHRLDKDTSGIVVLAKNVEVHAKLSRMFAERSVKKTYIALLFSTPRSKRLINKQDEGLIELNIGRDPKSRVKMSVTQGSGRNALTKWKVKERMLYSSLVEVDLLTGRTHQIRVHFAHYNSPVIGDKTYGDFSALPLKLKKAAEFFGRQALHSEKLEFKHPISGKLLKLNAAIPIEMKELINEFRSYKG